jgi:hypothetical protein
MKMLEKIKQKIKDDTKVSQEVKSYWDNFNEELYKEFVAQKKIYWMKKLN